MAPDEHPTILSFRRDDAGRKVWVGHTPTGETAEFPRRKDAEDWVMRHSCETFDGGWYYADLCRNCGGHVTMHEPLEDGEFLCL